MIGFESLNKTVQNKINSENLQFLKKYTVFYINKYIEFYEKAIESNY